MPIHHPPIITPENLEDHMILIEGGIFDMGADDIEVSKPTHKVGLDDFFLLRYPVSQSLWESVMDNNPAQFQHPAKPVENVTWDDCQHFLEKLNQKGPFTYRLPTEAEWEYAARGGKYSPGTNYSGSDVLNEVAWNFYNSHQMNQAIGLLKPNSLGIFDMAGNVNEWCQDWHGKGYYKTRSKDAPVRNPKGPTHGKLKLIRGGSLEADFDFMFHPAYRDSRFTHFHENTLGLRLARH